MSHFPTEAHLSTLSNSLSRMSREDIESVLEQRDSALKRAMQQTCLEDQINESIEKMYKSQRKDAERFGLPVFTND